jgi:hypothetical protein
VGTSIDNSFINYYKSIHYITLHYTIPHKLSAIASTRPSLSCLLLLLLRLLAGTNYALTAGVPQVAHVSVASHCRERQTEHIYARSTCTPWQLQAARKSSDRCTYAYRGALRWLFWREGLTAHIPGVGSSAWPLYPHRKGSGSGAGWSDL